MKQGGKNLIAFKLQVQKHCKTYYPINLVLQLTYCAILAQTQRATCPKKNVQCDAKFEVLTVVLMKIRIFQDVKQHHFAIYSSHSSSK